MTIQQLRRRTALIAAALIAAAWAWISSRPPEPPPPLVRSSASAVRQSGCAECHPSIHQKFQQAPHSHTLKPIDAAEVWGKFAGQSVEIRGETFSFESRGGRLWFGSQQHPQRLAVDWVFGSGRHALTPISLLENSAGRTELIQLHASWYPEHGLGETLGDEGRTMGLPHSPVETRECFDCHSSHAPMENGRLDFARLQAGVGCVRCHRDAAEHLASEGETTMERWASLGALESINRCGECHRRGDEFTPDELQPDAVRLVRFAPVGLSQSRCFQASLEAGLRLDCLTCHDPHQAAETDPQYYVRQCLSCHDKAAPKCREQPQDSACLSCHMRRVEVQKNLWFTDHWIR